MSKDDSGTAAKGGGPARGRKRRPGLSPELSEVLNMLKSLETELDGKPATAR